MNENKVMKIKRPILCLVKGREHFFETIKDAGCFDLVFEENWEPEVISKMNPSLVISVGESNSSIWNCFQKAKELGIPTLTLLDGIPEWRDIWENPRYGYDGGQLNRQLFQADKVACHGKYHAWLFQRWGIGEKAEIVGMPWMDKYFHFSKDSARENGKKNLLIMTANTPGFTQGQLEKTENALEELADALKEKSCWNPVWRLRGGLGERLKLQSPQNNSMSLFDTLRSVDAVITTPSTTQIESMLAHVPTALLDYTNSPHYVEAAWQITHSSHIAAVLNELEKAPRNKVLFQDDILHNYLECDTPATPRLVYLIKRMIELSETRMGGNNNPDFRVPIIRPSIEGVTLPSVYFELRKLYPNHPVYADENLCRLQLEVVNLREDNAILRNNLKKRNFGFWLGVCIEKVRKVSRKLGVKR
jgi:hypothetical protein